jgi:hypothetical protein
MKIYPVGTELFHADQRTDNRTDIKKNFANHPSTKQMKVWGENQ